MIEESKEAVPMQQWLSQLELIQMLWLWTKVTQTKGLLESQAVL
jgi:hypothetical protein